VEKSMVRLHYFAEEYTYARKQYFLYLFWTLLFHSVPWFAKHWNEYFETCNGLKIQIMTLYCKCCAEFNMRNSFLWRITLINYSHAMENVNKLIYSSRLHVLSFAYFISLLLITPVSLVERHSVRNVSVEFS